MRAPITDPELLEGYLTDASNVRGHAEGLFRPKTAREVAEILGAAQADRTPVTITAARTSTTGSPVPFGGWLLSVEHLKAIEHIGEHTATAEGGILLGEFQDAIEATGKFFPPDPTSRHDCTLGAAIACNASGARSFKYGPTRDWIEALEVVLPNGEHLTAQRGQPIPSDWPSLTWEPPKGLKCAAGYERPADLVDVFVGSEGTLGLITKATVRLTTLAAGVCGLVVFFTSRASAVAFVERLRTPLRAGEDAAVSPRCIEYLDHHCLALARARDVDVPDGACAALFCEQEFTDEEDLDARIAAWWTLLESSDALADDTILATDPSGKADLHALRHAVPAGINEQVVRNGMPKVGTDLAVPDAALSRMMDAYEAVSLPHVLFGHIGDNHLHLNLLPTSQEELATAKATYDELARLALSLGGTVSAEHGIGKLKVHQYDWMISDTHRREMLALKAYLDPGWVLGRGTLFRDPGTL